MTQRRLAQKVSMGIAILSYCLSVACLLAMFYLGAERGGDDPVVASFGASVVFFISVGVVLQVIGSVSIPDLRVSSGRDDGPVDPSPRQDGQ